MIMNDEKNMNIDDAAELSEKELQAFMEAADSELPDLWDKISSGYKKEFEAMQQSDKGDEKIIKYRRRKQLGFLAASVLLLAIAIPVIINTTKRSDKSEDIYINYHDKNDDKNDDRITSAADEAGGENYAEAGESFEDTEASIGVAEDSNEDVKADNIDEAPTNSDEKGFLLIIDGSLICFDEVLYIKVLAVYDNISNEAVKAGDIIVVKNSKELGEQEEADYYNIMITDISVSGETVLSEKNEIPEKIEIPEGASIFEAEIVFP